MFEYFIEQPPNSIVTDYVGEKLGFSYSPPYLSLGLIKDQQLVGGVVFHGFTDDDVELSVHAPGLINRRLMRMIATVAFQDNAKSRITCFTRPSNTVAQRTLGKIGFKYEGLRRQYYGDADGLMYGLLKTECRWLE